MIAVPEGLDWLHQSSDGQHWLAELSELIDQAADRWNLKVGDPFPNSYVSVVLPAERHYLTHHADTARALCRA